MRASRAFRLLPLLPALALLALTGPACDRADNDWALYDPDLKLLTVTRDTLVLAEGGESRTFRLALEMVPDDTVRVLVAADDSQIVAEPDTVLFVPVDDDWTRPRTVAVHALEDRIDEETATTGVTLTVESRDAGYDGQGGEGLVPVVILDNDTAGVRVSETALTLVESQAGTVTETYRLALLSQPLADVTITVSVAPDEPSFHVDPAVVVFTHDDWNVEQEIRLWAELDQVDADNMDLVLSHATASADANYGPDLAVADVAVALLDDTLPPTASLSLAVPGVASLDEAVGTTSLDVVVTLDRASVLPVTVGLRTRDGGAVGGADFSALDEDLVFAPGDPLSRTVTVAALDDALMEDPEDFQVVITAVANVFVGEANRLDLTIIDDDQVTLSAIGVDADEDIGGAGVLVTIPAAVPLPVVFTLTTADGTATAGADYTAVAGEFVIPAGATERFVPVVIRADDYHEGDEDLTASLSGLSGNASWDGVAATVVIRGDDPQAARFPDVAFSDGGTSGWFHLHLDAPFDHEIALTLNTLDGDGLGALNGQEDARGGPDFETITNRVWRIPAGTVHDSTRVTLLVDQAAEAEREFFRLTISAADEPGLAGLTSLATLWDADQPFIVMTDATANEVQPAAGFTASLVNAAGSPVTSQADVRVAVETVGQTATGDEDYVTTADTLTIAAGASGAAFTVPILDDAHDDDNETFVLHLSAPMNAGIADDGSAPFCLLVDNEFPSINLAQTIAAENEGSVHEFTVFLTTPRQDPTAFVLALDPGNSQGAGVDYEFTPAGLNVVPAFTSSVTFQVPFLDDQLAGEPLETLRASLDYAEVALGVDVLDMTIVDAPAVNIDPAAAAEGADLLFTVHLTAVSTADVVFGLQYSSGTANVLADLAGAPTGPFTIPAGQPSLVVPVTATAGDGGDLAVEDFVVTIIDPVNATLGAFNSATGEITDTDPSPLALAGDASAVEGSDVVFTVQLGWTSEADVEFFVVFSEGTAAGAGIDFDDSATGPFVVPAGASLTTVAVPTIALDGPELATEDFGIALVAGANGTLGAAVTATGFIGDGDQPRLTIPAGDTGVEGSDLQFTIHLDPPTIVPVFFDLVYGDGSTQGLADFTPTYGPFSMMPGTSDTTITVSTVEDVIFENTEQFVVRLGVTPTNAVVGTPAQANGVITDND